MDTELTRQPTDARVSASRDRMSHLKCLMFVAPDPETLEWVKEEISKPKYGSYWLCELCTLISFDVSGYGIDSPGRWTRLLKRLDKVGDRDACPGG